MTRRKPLTQRRAINRAIAERDAKNRCGYCKLELPKKVFLRWQDPAMYCSADCLDSVNERDGRTS